ncbi:MAG: tetratricopeptide repeat protein, partial [Bryobacteraceae bacterium]
RGCFEKALALQPKSVDALRAAAMLAVEQKDAAVALDCQSRLAGLGALAPELSFNVGLLLQDKSQHEAAARCYRQAIDQNPHFAEALLNLGHALKALGQESEARAFWAKAVAERPELAGQYFEPANH